MNISKNDGRLESASRADDTSISMMLYQSKDALAEGTSANVLARCSRTSLDCGEKSGERRAEEGGGRESYPESRTENLFYLSSKTLRFYGFTVSVYCLDFCSSMQRASREKAAAESRERR